jgi:hypothetical protein
LPPRIAYLVLAHQAPQQLRLLCRLLASRGGMVLVHVDAKAERQAFEQALAGLPRVSLLRQTLPIHWGGYHLVEATLRLCREALLAGADRLVLLSGLDLPIQPMAEIEAALAEPVDHIEVLELPDASLGRDGGLDRFRRLHDVDRWARWGLPPFVLPALHRRLLPRWHRQPPPGLRMRAGSQWWALQARSVRAVLELLAAQPAIGHFFRGCGIADELLFQTLLCHLQPAAPRAAPRRLIVWDREPKPYVFRNSDWPELMASDALFARKFNLAQDRAVVERLAAWHGQSLV